MARITVQMGHVPRTKGATGTHREQEFNKLVGPRLRDVLRMFGHAVDLIGADPTSYPPADAFVALHCDGNVNKAVRGASVGYPNADGQRLAAAWKRAHARRGFPGGFKADNYTAALRGYYAFGYTKARFKFLAEHGHTTNPYDEAWLFSHIDNVVSAHADAVGEVLGHPNQPTPGGGMQLNHPAVKLAFTPDAGGYWIFTEDGGVFTFGSAPFHGSMGGQPMNAKVVDAAVTPSGQGYWLLGLDGGVFTFGDAQFFGSTPIYGACSITPTPTGRGYILCGMDGGVFTFGDAPFHGSIPGL